MASDRPRQTLADYVALLISPALIVGLVGSLVFFLLEVLYPEDGEYKGRLQWWILFPFVFGAVLAGRVSLTAGIAGRAGLYGLILAVLTWIGMQAFVEYPKDSLSSSFNWLINGVLVLVVWWCAHRLTHDCTNIDEETEVPGEGVLQAAGLEKADAAAPAVPPPAPAAEEGKKRRSPGPLVEWWERFQRWREERKNRRVLGVWVIYFSLAAFPLYGLGEALIPVTETDRRQYAFWLMFAYVGCGLGLLLTTCFLGLRRYLRQRKLQMPAAMTGLWLSGGVGLILALLVIGALLPRPRAEYSWIPYQPVGGEKRDASNYAPKGGDSGKGPGNEAGKPQQAKPGEPADKDAKGGTQDKDKDKEGPAKEKDKDSGAKDKQSGEKSQDKESPAPKDKGEHPDKANDPQDKQQKPPQDAQRPRDDKTNSGKNDQPRQDPKSVQNRPTSSFNWTESLQSVATVLKWVVFALIALAVLFFILRSGLRFLANFTAWARRLLDALNNFWANLFAGWGKKKTPTVADDEDEMEQAAAARPFASFGNPFDDGRANRLSPGELVKYTFAALQAWAREHGQARQPGETPLEFAARLGDEFPALEADVKRLATLFARAVYDYTPLPANTVEVIRRFWQRLETAAKQPLSM